MRKGITVNRKKPKTKPNRFKFKDSVFCRQFNDVFHKVCLNPKWSF